MRIRPTPTAPAAPPLAPALAAVAAIALGACSRDVTLPPEPTAPRIASVSPAAAYAGERITVVASGLDPAADRNVVQFRSAVAPGESRSGDALVVRVPDDAGSGPLTVQASGGVSAPSEPFTYRGLGRLRTGAVSGEVRLLHKPYRVVAVGGDTFLHSDLLVALVRYADPAFVGDLAMSVDARPSTGEAVWLTSEWNAPGAPDVSRLSRLDAATAGAAPVSAEIAFAGAGRVVVLRGATPDADRIAVLRPTETSTTLALYEPAAFAEVEPEADLGVWDVRGCADAGGGELACLVRATPGVPLALALVTPGAPQPVRAIPLPPDVAIQEDPTDVADPICAGGLDAGRGAVVALEDGRIAVAALDGDPAWRALDTLSRTPARSLACAPIGGRPTAIAAKRADDLVVALDLGSAPARVLRWTASVPRASRVAVDTTATDTAAWTVHVAGEGDNRVAVLDAATGAVLAHRGFDVAPGRAGAMQGAAWLPAGAGAPPSLVFAVGAPAGVLEVPLTTAPDTFPTYLSVPDAVGVFAPLAPYEAAAPSYATLLRYGLQAFGHAWSFHAPLDPPLDVPLEAQLGLAGTTDVYVGTAGGLVTIDGSAPWPDDDHLSAIEGATFASIGALPPDRVFAAVGDGSGAWTVRAWTRATAVAGGGADATWTSDGELAGAALLDGALWAFHRDVAGDFVATLLDGALRDVRTVPMPEAFDRILAVSPNGRTFVTWEYQPWSVDANVVVWAAEEGGAWERVATVALQGAVSGVAFAGTGEALYVLTRSPDRVVVLE